MSSLFKILQFEDLGSAIQSTVSAISICLSTYAIIVAKKAIKTKVEIPKIDLTVQSPVPYGFQLSMEIELSNTGFRDITVKDFDIVFKQGLIKKLHHRVQQLFKEGMKLSFFVIGVKDDNGKVPKNKPFIIQPGQLQKINLSGTISYKDDGLLYDDTTQEVYNLIHNNLKKLLLRAFLSNGKVVKVNGSKIVYKAKP